MITTRALSGKDAEVGPFYVRSEVQGQGVAAALMQALVQHAPSVGAWQLELTVAQRNARAIRFYEGQKFIRRGEMPDVSYGENGLEDDCFYTRDLRE